MVKIPIRILIVDDERDFIEMLSMRLEQAGEKIWTAFSGMECMDILSETSIDVIIMDLRMPGMDGIETLRGIKKHYPLTEVILLTGHGSAETAVEGLKLGAFDYLIKPADFKELTDKLMAAWHRREEQVERIRQAEVKLLLRRGGDV